MVDQTKGPETSSLNNESPAIPLCDSWSYTHQGGYIDHNGIFYEIKRLPNTLSDQLMSFEEDFAALPQTSSPGLLINGDQLKNMNLEEVESRKKEFRKTLEDQGLIQQDDGTWSYKEEIESTRIARESDIFKSLPLIEYDEKIHHAKIPRNISEIKNLITVQGLPHLVQLLGRTQDGKIVTLRFGNTLANWIEGPFVEGRKIQLPQEWYYQWIVDIILGLSNLHQKGIFHKDLTSYNVLIHENHAILCDLECGPSSVDVQPPELVQGIVKEYNEKMDIYGLGIMLWVIENRNNARPHRTLKCTGKFAGLMSKCLADNPTTRPTINEIINELQGMSETRSSLPEDSYKPLDDLAKITKIPDNSRSYYIDRLEQFGPLNWHYTLKGAIIKHNDIFYEIIRIPITYSDRVINQRADLPIVPWAGARIVGDRVEELEEEDIQTVLEESGRDANFGFLPNGGEGKEQTSSPKRLIVESDIFKSLPIIDYDETIHYAKIPWSIAEIKNLLTVKGVPNLVQIVGRSTKNEILTERFGMDITNWIVNRSMKIQEEWKISWMIDVAKGLSKLHERNILHKDLMAFNILFERDHAIICDLESITKVGSADAPEYVQNGLYDEKSDIYSFGQLLWSIENRNMPRPHATLECCGVFKDIMSRCLAVNPTDRPTMDQIVAQLHQLSAGQITTLLPVSISDETPIKDTASVQIDAVASSIFPEPKIPHVNSVEVADCNVSMNNISRENEMSCFSITKPQNPDWLEWLYNDTGATITYNGTFYSITRIPETYSCRIINQKADFPIVPWPGAKIVGDKVEEMTENDIRIRNAKAAETAKQYDLQEEEEEKVAQLIFQSDTFNSLPLIEFDSSIHHSKVPRYPQEIENLLKVEGESNLNQIIGRGKDNTIITKKFGKSLSQLCGNMEFKRTITEEQKLNWAIEAAKGLSNLHKRNILHKDLSSNNLLIEGDQAILCDLESMWTTGCARAPEHSQKKDFDKAADMYGFGTLLWNIENKNMPRPHALLGCTGVLKDVMAKCLNNDPGKRPTIDEVLVELQSLSSSI